MRLNDHQNISRQYGRGARVFVSDALNTEATNLKTPGFKNVKNFRKALAEQHRFFSPNGCITKLANITKLNATQNMTTCLGALSLQYALYTSATI